MLRVDFSLLSAAAFVLRARCIAGLLTLATLLLPTASASAQLLSRTVDVNGVTREYVVYLPPGYDGSTALPVMLAYHGGGGTGQGHLALTQMPALADEHQFILVGPQGLEDDDGDTIWNSEGPFSNGVDEIGFTSNMIDALTAEFAVDETRVYASGYSNGANMAWELGCLLSDRIAAVGPVAGSVWVWTLDLCSPSRPVPVVSIHGTLDFFNPYEGNEFSVGLIEASEYWVEQGEADPTPTIIDVPDTFPGDGSTVDHYIWGNGVNCYSVEHYKVENGGHDWPGVFGNMDIDASEIIWNFVSQFDLLGRIECGDDADEDGVPDNVDNCTLVANPDQLDGDDDLIGNICDADLTNDCRVNFADFMAFRPLVFSDDQVADFNGDGIVNQLDLAILRRSVGGPPGPSALGCN